MMMALSSCDVFDASVGTPTADLADPSPGAPGAPLAQPLQQGETAMAVVPPGAFQGQPDGIVLVTWEQNHHHFVSYTPLSKLWTPGATTGIDVANDALPDPPGDVFAGIPDGTGCLLFTMKPLPKYVSYSSDVQIVHMGHGMVGQLGLGRIGHSPRGIAFGEPCNRPWFGTTKNPVPDFMVFRVSMDGGAPGTWVAQPPIEADMTSTSMDRPELFYNPKDDHLYITATMGRLYVSDDHGQTWVRKHNGVPNWWTPIAMAASDGRVYFLENGGSKYSELHYTEDHGDSVHTINLPHQPAFEWGMAGSDADNINALPGNMRNIKPTPSIAVAESDSGNDVITIFSPIYEKILDPNPPMPPPLVIADRQSARLTRFVVSRVDNSISSATSVVIRASSGINQDSILYPQIISSNDDGALLATWHETDSTISPPGIRQKALPLGPFQPLGGTPAPIDVNLKRIVTGATTSLVHDSWSTSGYPYHAICGHSGGLDRLGHQKLVCWTGDYHYGVFLDSSYLQGQDRQWRFLVGWSEPDPSLVGWTMEARTNIVTVTSHHVNITY